MELLNQSELARLTPPERLTLIAQLWDSLEEEQLPLSTAQRDELDRRLDTLEADHAAGESWETVKAELERRVP